MCTAIADFMALQGNEAEALRSWRSALDQIYYHNAYRVPAGYIPKSETEKALKDSLRDMEMQCKERVDLLEALKHSRQEKAEKDKEAGTETFAEPSVELRGPLGYATSVAPSDSVSNAGKRERERLRERMRAHRPEW
jgi:hypothetical protein